MTKTRPFLSTCYGYPSTTEVPPCCQAATKKLTFSTTSVLLLLNVPLSLSRGTVFRRQKNPRRGYRPKIAGILFVCNEPEGKYYTVPSQRSQRVLALSVGSIENGGKISVSISWFLVLGNAVIVGFLTSASQVYLAFRFNFDYCASHKCCPAISRY